MEEKRNFVRVKGLQDICFRVKGENASFARAAVKNISLRGVSILATGQLGDGTALEIMLELPGSSKPVPIDGTVVWQMPDGSGTFTTGIQFQEIDAGAREHLSTFIMACARRVEEKREFVRCAMEISVSYRHHDPSQGECAAQSVDISRGGMKILVNEPLALGTRLMVTFCLPRDQAAITCDSEVVWVQPTDASIRRIGVRFLNISQRDADRVWDFVTQHCATTADREEI